MALRPPVAGATRLAPVAGTVALLVIGDRLDRVRRRQGGPAVQRPRPGPAGLLHVARGRARASGWSSAFVVGLLVAVGDRRRALERSASAGMPRAGSGGLDRAQLGRRFAHTLIPIAAAYLVAHYFSLLAYNGQDLWRLASRPARRRLGPLRRRRALDRLRRRERDGDLVRPGRSRSSSATWPRSCSPTTARSSSTARPQAATRSQVVMLVLMVAFTCLGLWLLSAALNA